MKKRKERKKGAKINRTRKSTKAKHDFFSQWWRRDMGLNVSAVFFYTGGSSGKKAP